MSANLSVDINVSGPGGTADFTGSGAFVPAKPGSLHTDLLGTINASPNGLLTFPGGSEITFANPDALAFTTNIPLSGPISGFSLQLSGKFHDLVLDVRGTTPLAGAPGNRTFNTSGLDVFTLAGTFDGTATACVPTCMAPTAFSVPLADPSNPDTLPAGNGSLVTANGKTTLSFPIVIADNVTQTDTQTVQPGVTATTTITLDGNLDGLITASVPEPANYIFMLVGVVALAYVSRRRA